LAVGFTITSAAAHETRIISFSSQSALICMVSPLVDGPMMASTFSSSINCLANDTAFSGLPPLSLSTNSTLRPWMPPAALSLSTNNRTVFSSGAPRKEAGPVTEKMAPILMESPPAAAWMFWVRHCAPSAQIPATSR